MQHEDKYDSHEDPVARNNRLAALLQLEWSNYEIVKIVRLPTQEEPPSEESGWRAYFS